MTAMPAIIAAEEHQRWFDGFGGLLVPYSPDKMTVVLEPHVEQLHQRYADVVCGQSHCLV
jgi:hypothetical protein